MSTRLEKLHFSTTHPNPTRLERMLFEVTTDLNNIKSKNEALATPSTPSSTPTPKPKVYYKTITDDEAELLKLRRDDEGFYTRSTKIQADVKTYIELPGQALDIFPYGQTYDREINAVRREKIKKHGAKYDKEMGVWYAETRKDARALIAAGYRVDNHPDNWRTMKTASRNHQIDPKNEDRSSWELWCHNTLTDTWMFYKKEHYYRTWG